jgi:hypothetical protein
MATTSNVIQWPTHKRKAAERRRTRRDKQRGLWVGKTSSNETKNTVCLETATNQESLVVVYQTEYQETD